MIVLDTSTLIYWTLAPDKLSDTAKEMINGANVINICSISVWEVGIKVKKQHLRIGVSLKEYVEALQEVEKIRFVPVNEKMWLENIALDWHLKDPADRTIVACAKLLDCPLVTSDRVILSFYQQAVW